MDTAQLSQDIPENALWLNAPAATLMHFQGRPLAVAFVNAASAWCRQRLVELQQWMVRNPGRLQLVLVQVPRFDFEREGERTLALLQRAGITAPVVLDSHWEAWRRFGVESWPTVVLIDANSREAGRLVGLGEPLEPALAGLCQGAPAAGGRPIAMSMGPDARGELRHPTGLVVTPERLYLADSGNHRVLECNHHGRILRQFGTGTADMTDGSAEVAGFNRPHGLALGHGQLYVADTGNHAIRRINLSSGLVDTVLGSGRSGDPVEGTIQQARDTPLCQPSGLVMVGNELLVSLCGDNRVWSYDLGSRRLAWRAGSGALDLRDGGGHLAAFAQPVWLTQVDGIVYVCDALSSAVRSLQLRGELVQTVTGQGMWQFGHADGGRSQALLQYPLAIAGDAQAQLLWVADAGNGLLRRIRLAGKQVDTVELPRRLNGAAGLAVCDGTVWIADTEGHAVLRYDPATGQTADVPIGQ